MIHYFLDIIGTVLSTGECMILKDIIFINVFLKFRFRIVFFIMRAMVVDIRKSFLKMYYEIMYFKIKKTITVTSGLKHIKLHRNCCCNIYSNDKFILHKYLLYIIVCTYLVSKSYNCSFHA